VRLARLLESEPEIVGSSAHLIVAARKPAVAPPTTSATTA
jgi:hypothetical protein